MEMETQPKVLVKCNTNVSCKFIAEKQAHNGCLKAEIVDLKLNQP